MPPLAAVAGAVAGAIGAAGAAVAALTVAEGILLAGTALSAIGTISGSKTLTKMGAGLGLIGGVGTLAGKANTLSVGSTGNSTSSVGNALDATDDVGKAASGSLANNPTMKDLKHFTPTENTMSSMSAFKEGAANIGNGANNLAPKETFFGGMSNTLNQHTGLLNMAGGMGNAYMQNNAIEARRDINRDNLEFEQREIDRRNNNLNGGNRSRYVQPRITVNPTAYNGMLRIQ